MSLPARFGMPGQELSRFLQINRNPIHRSANEASGWSAIVRTVKGSGRPVGTAGTAGGFCPRLGPRPGARSALWEARAGGSSGGHREGGQGPWMT